MTRLRLGFLLDGEQRDTGSHGTYALANPATGEAGETAPCGGLAEAIEAARLSADGFAEWSAVAPFDRARVMRSAAEIMRAEVDDAAQEITREMGKPAAQAQREWLSSADLLDWYADEGRRSYGRIVPSREAAVDWSVRRKPVGPVAAFCPWNFPAWTVMQKVAPALAAGCSVVVKPSEETPSSGWRIARALLAAGLPARAISVIWGKPAEISEALIAAPEIRKISLTGSTRVGRLLAAAAGAELKKVTMELGGHNPVIIARDAPLDQVIALTAEWKYRNAGQVCVSPTRFLVEEPVYADFVSGLARAAEKLRVGNGADPATDMGPLATQGQLSKIESLVEDAIKHGAKAETGGARIGNRGFFYAPTVLSGVTPQMRIMNEEPFGPVALVMPVADLDAALTEANRLNYGLASYAFTRSNVTERRIAQGIRAGMLAVNHYLLAMPETPAGGVMDSGMGSEGGIEGIEAYLRPFLVSSKVL